MSELVCPRDKTALRSEGDVLVCSGGHRYPVVDGVPVLVVDELAPTQPGYWASTHEVEQARERAAHVAAHPTLDPYVRELLVGTCGNLYRRARLDRYPIPELPLPPGEGRLFVELGSNWGRWSIAAAQKGYRVIGVDPSIAAVLAGRRIAEHLGVELELVVADARALPFADASVDVVFSYSVLQHFAKADVRTALAEAGRIVRPGGTTCIQMANAWGLRNLALRARRRFAEADGFGVRYWSPRELRRAWLELVGPAVLRPDGYFTLNGQPSDRDLLPQPERAFVGASAALCALARKLPPLTAVADSVQVWTGDAR
ncbi:MAG: hypothetical protein QOH73_1927 [Gaiellaceae bacterium]|nr:hypothetical protein [Gaiellaceae bacterium]